MSRRLPEIFSFVLVGISLVILLVLLAVINNPNVRIADRYGNVIHEERSEFSTIRIREKGEIRSLLFVDSAGAEQCQSSLNPGNPLELQLGYTKALFASHLFKHPQERVLVIGLGAGGMLQFINHAFPETVAEAVEIDPVVVRLADEYFGTTESERLIIHTEDAFEFFKERKQDSSYDVVYMDAFLRAPADSGLEEKTRRLKTVSFLNDIKSRLTGGGVVAFNLLEADVSTEDDLRTIREVFPGLYRFSVPGTGNLVVIASGDETALSQTELNSRAEALDATGTLDWKFAEIVVALYE